MRKFHTVLLLVLVATALLYSGCVIVAKPKKTEEAAVEEKAEEKVAETVEKPAEKPAEKKEAAPLPDLPEWYLMPPLAEDAIYGLGEAKMSTASLSRITAVARARADLSFQISTSIKAAITDYAQEAGTGDSKQVIQFVETISRQITETKLQGAKTVNQARGKDGTFFVLLSYPMNQFMDDVKDSFEQNQGAAFAEFKADQALAKLKGEMSENPPKAGQSEK